MQGISPHAKGVAAMLVLGRNIGDTIVINDNIYITLFETS
ncbi:MAG: carbon storage regulator, partial [Subdoligranulum sp.]|nr:carbon storage regulator [Subdoligranulum sp.]